MLFAIGAFTFFFHASGLPLAWIMIHKLEFHPRQLSLSFSVSHIADVKIGVDIDKKCFSFRRVVP